MREQFLPDGSKNYGQGVIGPSAQDIAFFNNPDRSPLDHFPTRQTLTTTAIIVTPFAVSGCISVSPAKTGEVQQSAGGETSLSGEISIGDRFDSFLTLYNDKQTEIGVVEAWIDALGIPKSAIKYDDTYDFLSSPLEATTAYFSIIPNDGIRPSKGDIAVISPTSDYANGTLGIATGDQESFEGNLYERVFMHYNGNPNTIDSFSPYDILAWLKPKDIVEANGQGDQGNDVLVARKESVAEHFQSFIDKYSGQFVEKNDASNLNQCMDLVTAWADELGIPRDAVTGLLYAKNLYLTPKKSTKDYFEIISYEEGLTPQVGDVVVWDEGIGGVAGHAAIANGLGGTDTFEAFSQNYPTGSETHTEDFRFDHVLGWLRPKGFGPRPQEPKLIKEPEQAGEFIPNTPEEFARYQIAEMLLRSFNESRGGYGYWTKWTEISESEREKIKRKFAKGEEVESIHMYEISYHSGSGLDYPPPFELYLYDDQGDIYEQNMRLVDATYSNPEMKLDKDLNGPEVRNGYRIVWSGEVRFTGEIRYGAADITARDTADNLDQIVGQGSGFSGFDKITQQSSWIPTNSLMSKIYVYESGDVECDGYNTAFNDLEGCSGLQRFSIADNFGLVIHSSIGDDGGYNGQFVIEP